MRRTTILIALALCASGCGGAADVRDAAKSGTPARPEGTRRGMLDGTAVIVVNTRESRLQHTTDESSGYVAMAPTGPPGGRAGPLA